MNEQETEAPEYTPVCEICGNGPAALTADPDRGGLLLCTDCRRLFGFEVEPDRPPLMEEIPY